MTSHYQFIIGEAIADPLTPLYLASAGRVHPITQLIPTQVRAFVGLSKTAAPFNAAIPRSVSVYRDDDLIKIAGLTTGLEYHLGLTGPVLLSSLPPVAWSLRLGMARSSSRLLFKRGDVSLVAQLQAELMTWRHFTAIAGQRIFNMVTVPWDVFLIIYDGAVMTPGTGLFNWSAGDNQIELTFDAIAGAKVSVATR